MNECICPTVLPDITMYGGDADTWEISLYRDDSTPYTADELEDCTCVLDVLPMTDQVYKTGVLSDPLALSKTGSVSANDDGGASAIFSFLTPDTIDLRGVYIYQISVSFNDLVVRVSQGKLTIIPNVKRGAL